MDFTNGTNNRTTHKDAIFNHIPPSVNQGVLTFTIFNGHESRRTMKNQHKAHHSTRFEPVTVSNITNYNKTNSNSGAGINGCHGKVQHFKHGGIAGGDNSNNLIYGSSALEPYGIDLNSIKPKPKPTSIAPVKKYYQTPDHFLYGQRDFVYDNNKSKKLSNIFSLEERTSAEMRKKEREARDTENDYLRYRQEKESTRQRIVEEKRKDHEMLVSYKAPWGKAGGGAPNDNEHHERTQQVRRLLDDKEQTFPFGRPGAGAPLKTNSGNLKTGLHADPEIRFQKRDRNQIYDVIVPEGKSVGQSRKYPYETNLDILAHESRAMKRQVVKRNDDMSTSVYDPFGRPGAGAPLRDSKGKANANRSRNLMRTIEGNNDPNPNEVTKNGFYGGFGRGGPNVDEEGVAQTYKKQTLIRGGDGAIMKTHSNEHLDTRGGGGAPIRNPDNGQLMATVSGRLANDDMDFSSRPGIDAESRKRYLETLRLQAEEQENYKRAQRSEISKPSVDTTSWIKQGKVGRLPIDDVTHEMVSVPRVTSDVVKQRLEIKSEDRSKFHDYHKELEEHTKLVQQTRQLKHKQDREKSVEHARTMDTIWGKPGNGAPNITPRRRKHLEDDVDETVLERDNIHYQDHEYESPSKRSRLSLASQQQEQQSDFSISSTENSPTDFPVSTRDTSTASTQLSDSGETITENTVSYVARAKDNRNGTNIVRHVVAHEKVSNSNANKNSNNKRQTSAVAPFATDYNNHTNSIVDNGVNLVGRAQNQHSGTSSIHPVLPPSSWHIESDVTDYTHDIGVEDDIYDAPPPPGTIVLSNAIKKKLMLQQQAKK